MLVNTKSYGGVLVYYDYIYSVIKATKKCTETSRLELVWILNANLDEDVVARLKGGEVIPIANPIILELGGGHE